MASLKTIRRELKHFMAAAAILALVSQLCGCQQVNSYTGVFGFDRWSLNTNGYDRMRLSRDILTFDFADTKQNIYSNEDGILPGTDADNSPLTGPSYPSYQTPNQLVIQPSEFAPLTNPTVVSSDYVTYLREQVYGPISELLRERLAQDASLQDQIYFRVMHSGYNYDTRTGRMYKASGYDTGNSYRLPYAGGSGLLDFTNQWLSQLPINSTAADIAKASFLSQVNATKLDDSTDWLIATGVASLDKDILAMWGNDTVGAKTWGEFKSLVTSIESDGLLGVIPNIPYYVYTRTDSKSALLLDRTSSLSSLSTTKYVDNLSRADLNLIFTTYNQFATRSADVIDSVWQDDESILMGYCDGYTKTLVYLATAPGKTLEDVLGEQASEIVSLVSNALSPIEWEAINAIYSNITVIPSGSVGVD